MKEMPHRCLMHWLTVLLPISGNWTETGTPRIQAETEAEIPEKEAEVLETEAETLEKEAEIPETEAEVLETEVEIPETEMEVTEQAETETEVEEQTEAKIPEMKVETPQMDRRRDCLMTSQINWTHLWQSVSLTRMPQRQHLAKLRMQ